MEQNLYKILNVSESATKEEIKFSYKKLVRKFHPDVNSSSDAEEMFKKINQAFEILFDDEKRMRYDTINSIMPKGSNTSAQEKKIFHESFVYKTKRQQKDKTFGEKIKDFFEYQKEKTHEKLLKEDGEDIYVNVSLTSFEAMTGVIKKVNILHSEVCPKCLGRKFINKTKCSLCNGEGEISEHKKISVKIPKGVSENSKIRLKNQGKLGKNGGKNGDVYITVKIEKVPGNIKIEDGIATMEVPITPIEAIFGATVKIPTLLGNAKLKIPPYTKSKQKFRLAQSGVLDKISGKYGDFIVTTIIQIPDSLSEDEISVYRTINDFCGNKLREGLFEKDIY